MSAILALFQSSGTSPDHQVTSQWHQPSPSAPLYVPCLVPGAAVHPISSRAISLFSSTVGNATFPQTLLADSNPGGLRTDPTSESHSKKRHQVPLISFTLAPLSSRLIFSQPSFCHQCTQRNLPVARFSSSWALPFPALSLQAWPLSLCPSWIVPPSLYTFFFCVGAQAGGLSAMLGSAWGTCALVISVDQPQPLCPPGQSPIGPCQAEPSKSQKNALPKCMVVIL